LADSTVITEVISETSMQPVDVEQDALALLLFTSGTSGAPRPAMHSHRNLLVNQQQMLAADPTSMLRGDLVLGVLLLHHLYGLNVALGVALRVGATVVLAERFDVDATFELVSSPQITVIGVAPPV
jgi:long-chain acyl-CoA synthetase